MIKFKNLKLKLKKILVYFTLLIKHSILVSIVHINFFNNIFHFFHSSSALFVKSLLNKRYIERAKYK